MKIVNRKTFLGAPVGTVFTKYQPCFFGDMRIKDSSLKNDFCYQEIIGSIDADDPQELMDKLHASEAQGKSVDIDLDCLSRDGYFDDDQLFAVWERGDVEKLIQRLQKCLEGAA
jgi:hypothetical protein